MREQNRQNRLRRVLCRVQECAVVIFASMLLFLAMTARAQAFPDAMRTLPALPGEERGPARADDAPMETKPARQDAREQRLHVSGSIQYQQYRGLAEIYTFNPASSLLPGGGGRSKISWEEKRAWARAEYDLFAREHYLLQPGLLLGVVKGRFAAANETFTEAWDTRPALLWGFSLAGELRWSPASGPFLKMRYVQNRAGAMEESETVRTSLPGASASERDARFRWRENEVFLGAGCRWKTVQLTGGAVYTDFRLEKWLHNHLSEAGADPADLDIIRALNSSDSEYHYRNGVPWRPFLDVEYTFSPAWAAAAAVNFGRDQDYSLALRLNWE